MVATISLVVGLTVCFYLFRGRTHFLGDGIQLISWLEQHIHNKPWEKGTFQIQSLVFLLLGGSGRETARLALQLVSVLAGSITLLGLALFAHFYFTQSWKRILFLVGVASSGFTLLYFGYIESYPMFATAVTLFVLAGLLVAKKKISKWWLLLPMAFAGYCHLFAAGLLPAFIYLLVGDTAFWKKHIVSNRKILATIVAIPVVAGIVGLILIYSGHHFLRFVFVPVVDGPLVVQSYTMFSGKHLLDYLNLLFLLCPSLLVLIVASRGSFLSALKERNEIDFLTLLTTTCLTMTFLINPGLGMPRDWDLFAFAGIPIAALGFLLLLDSGLRKSIACTTTLLAISLNLFVLAPRVAIEAIPDKGIARADNVHDLDPIRNRVGKSFLIEYFVQKGDSAEASRRRVEFDQVYHYETMYDRGATLLSQGQIGQAAIFFRNVLKNDPTYVSAWSDLAACYRAVGKIDSAFQLLQTADAVNPFNSKIQNNLGALHFDRGEITEAERYYHRALELDSTNSEAYDNLLFLYMSASKREDFHRLIEKVVVRYPDDLNRQRLYADFLLRTGSVAKAAGQYRRCLSLGMDSSVVVDLQRQYPALQVIK